MAQDTLLKLSFRDYTSVEGAKFEAEYLDDRRVARICLGVDTGLAWLSEVKRGLK